MLFFLASKPSGFLYSRPIYPLGKLGSAGKVNYTPSFVCLTTGEPPVNYGITAKLSLSSFNVSAAAVLYLVPPKKYLDFDLSLLFN